MKKQQAKKFKRQIRHDRVRNKIFGTGKRPRLSVFRASRHIYAQLIDDDKGVTLTQASSLELNSPQGTTGKAGRKCDMALEVGKLLAKKALEADIKTAVFDRGGFAYHGRIKALADGAREGGLKF